MVRDHLLCDADFPTEWIETCGASEPIPPGRVLAHYLQAILDDNAVRATEVWNEEDYAWAFNCQHQRITICVQAARLENHWLIIFTIVSLVPRFLRSQIYERSLQAICDVIDKALKSDNRFHNLRWFSAAEFDAFEQSPGTS